MRIHKKKNMKSERKIKKRNKNLLIDKILAYNPKLIDGIEIYKDANRNFILLIFLGSLLINFPLISVPCCVLALFFLIRMLQFIKHKSIYDIVNVLAKDLSFKGIYNQDKVDNMLEDFRIKYGNDSFEYEQLINMLDKYETLVMNIQLALNNINYTSENSKVYDIKKMENEFDNFNEENNLEYATYALNNKKKSSSYHKTLNEKESLIYKDEEGNIKEINKVIEFFNSNEIVEIKNTNEENKKLKVYIYKKASPVQKKIL